MDMANPRRSGKRRERAAVEGRCHRAPGIDTTETATVSTTRFGDAASIKNPSAAQIIQPMRIGPQLAFIWSTMAPPMRLTAPNPPWRMPNMKATWKFERPMAAWMAGIKTGNPWSYKWEIPWPNERLPRIKFRLCLRSAGRCIASAIKSFAVANVFKYSKPRLILMIVGSVRKS